MADTDERVPRVSFTHLQTHVQTRRRVVVALAPSPARPRSRGWWGWLLVVAALLSGFATLARGQAAGAPPEELPTAADLRALTVVRSLSSPLVVTPSPGLETSTVVDAEREVQVVVRGLDRLHAESPKKVDRLELFLDGRVVGGVQSRYTPGTSALRFKLARDDKGLAAWSEVQRRVRWRSVTLTVGVERVGLVDSEVHDFRVLLKQGAYMWAALLYAAAAAVLFIAWRTGALREGPDTYAGRAPYSLERTQVTFVSFFFLAAYAYLWLVTGETQPLDADALALLGVVFGTFVASGVLQSRTTVEEAAMHRRAVTQGFWSDIASDADGVSLVHVLVIVWTLVLVGVIGLAVENELRFPTITVTLTIATALVNGLYLAVRAGLGLGLRRAEPAAPPPEAITLQEAEDIALPPPEIPDELVRALRDRQCVLYAGAGVSANAGLPTWRPFVAGLVRWARAEQLVDDAFARALEQSIARGGVDRAADGIVGALVERKALDRLHQYLGRTFGTIRDLPAVHHLIGRLPFSAALTTNIDDLLERAFLPSMPLAARVPGDIEALRSDVAAGRFFLLKLYGDLRQPASLLVSPAQYVERIRGDQPFLDFVEQVFKSRTLLFLGASVAGIEAYLAPLGIRPPGRTLHYALVAVTDAGWRTDADLLERRYGIRVLPYRATARHEAVPDFLARLAQRLEQGRRTGPGEASAAGQPSRDPALIVERIELENIGPFEKLDLPFTRRWTVLIGDNGVGKSSVLRAIGTVVAGDVASAEGGRLLRSGRTEGSIRVTSRGRHFSSQVALDSLGRPEARADAGAGLGGSVLVMSFPAIRTMAPTTSQGPELKESKDLEVPPNALDVLPGLASLPDPRILGLKQWLINLDYARRRDPALLAPRIDPVFAELGKTLQALLGGKRVGDFVFEGRNVLVQTADGLLPLESLSQGTVSLLGWVGVLVQRLHEAPSAAKAGTLVLVDEIDAHMHPEWQQAIIKRLSDAFANVQFIVSSHSPFLAVGREAGEIVRFRRDPRTQQVLAEPTDRDTKGMTVADVLTSYLFGLQTPVDPELEEGILRLRQLSVQPVLSPSEKAELGALQQRLGHVGLAATQADPMYGHFIEELRRQRIDSLAEPRPPSPEVDAELRERTKRMVRDMLGGAADRPPDDKP